MHLLIDSDSLCYKAGFVCNEPGQENLACWQLDVLVNDIMDTTKADSQQCYLTGGNNFRYAIYPEYKGNRKNMARPIHLQALREHLVMKWGATITDGIEADDAVGIAEYQSRDDTVMAHLDKDLDMLSGFHYNYNTRVFYAVSDEQAMRHFYKQLLLGDRADNIPSFDGIMRATVPKKLQHHYDFLMEADNDEALAHIALMYPSWTKFNISASCLWIQREEDDTWQKHQNPELLAELEQSLTEDDGPEEDMSHSFVQPYEQPADAGL